MSAKNADRMGCYIPFTSNIEMLHKALNKLTCEKDIKLNICIMQTLQISLRFIWHILACTKVIQYTLLFFPMKPVPSQPLSRNHKEGKKLLLTFHPQESTVFVLVEFLSTQHCYFNSRHYTALNAMGI
jgi:hypothetical protein